MQAPINRMRVAHFAVAGVALRRPGHAEDPRAVFLEAGGRGAEGGRVRVDQLTDPVRQRHVHCFAGALGRLSVGSYPCDDWAGPCPGGERGGELPVLGVEGWRGGGGREGIADGEEAEDADASVAGWC